ncbi:MAG TPA: hypothetical protein QF695_16735, partial [Arenicellales bacterium]|nr:hypothetical protein [Arenicellales bacterium]
PDDIAEGIIPQGKTLVYDFDNYYLGGVLAEHLAKLGSSVEYATPAGHASAWTIMTNEQPYVHQALYALGVAIHTQTLLTGFEQSSVSLANIFTGHTSAIDFNSVVLVGLRLPDNKLYDQIMDAKESVKSAGIKSVERIGDAIAAGALVHAVYSGHQYARNLDKANRTYLRDVPVVSNGPGLAI